MVKVMVIGAMGRMGRTVCAAVNAEEGLQLAAAVDVAFAGAAAREAFGIPRVSLYDSVEQAIAGEVDDGGGKIDVAVDFTIPATVFANVMACLKQGIHCVVGTTGLSEEEQVQIEAQCLDSHANCLIAPNFAIGAVLMMDICQVVARYMPYVEIIELHHEKKLDAPSGTALRTAELIAAARVESPEPTGPEDNPARGLGRSGIPIHSVRLPGLVAHQEVIFGGQGQTLSIRHDSISRESFMPGVVLAIRRVAALNGLAVGLEKVM